MAAAIIFAAAPLEPTPRLRARLSEVDKPYVVAADRGAATALAFGLAPNLVIGDLDSIDAETLKELERRGTSIETYPRDKDVSDSQLAVDRALERNPEHALLLGFLGGPRLDHALANVHLLTRVPTRALLLDADNECTLVRPGEEYTWGTEPEEVISLIPLSAQAEGVCTRGLRWALNGEALELGDTRGISNEPVAEQAGVSIDGGLLLVTRHFSSV